MTKTTIKKATTSKKTTRTKPDVQANKVTSQPNEFLFDIYTGVKYMTPELSEKFGYVDLESKTLPTGYSLGAMSNIDTAILSADVLVNDCDNILKIINGEEFELNMLMEPTKNDKIKTKISFACDAVPDLNSEILKNCNIIE